MTLNVGSSKWQQYVEHISPYIVRSSHPLRHAIIVALKRSAANPYMADIKWMQYQIQALRFYISMHASVCLIIIIIIVIIMRIYRLLLLILWIATLKMSIVRMWRWSNQPLLPISTIPLYRPISPPLAIQLPRYLLSLSRPRHHYLPLPLNASTHISRTSISPPTRHPTPYIHYSYYRIVSLPFHTPTSISLSLSLFLFISIYPYLPP